VLRCSEESVVDFFYEGRHNRIKDGQPPVYFHWNSELIIDTGSFLVRFCNLYLKCLIGIFIIGQC